jgi:hypothetical protein
MALTEKRHDFSPSAFDREQKLNLVNEMIRSDITVEKVPKVPY